MPKSQNSLTEEVWSSKKNTTKLKKGRRRGKEERKER